ncbi:MAG: hypothetical protein CL526_01020 [Aequorivita sp.]|nr:hypothetical protein [Aequorivita sp.]|tara:strand:- start:76818 stop:77348 length:531 start_codon:yes stop_codon:yes gene_type:complete
MRKLWILLFCCSISFSQEDNIKQLLSQAETAVYSNPQEAIRIATYVSNKTENSSQKIEASYVLTRSYYIQGKLNKAVETGLKAVNQHTEPVSETHIKLTLLLSKILKELGLHKLASTYITKTNNLTQRGVEKDIETWITANIIQHNLDTLQDKKSKNPLTRLQLAKAQFDKIPHKG